MTLFVDTSALYALLSAHDAEHRAAAVEWAAIGERQDSLLTSNYALVETVALIGRRLGLQAVRDFQADFVPILHIAWVEQALHERAVAALLTAGTRDLSLVDCVSFEVMRERGIEAAFAFDAHFVQQGFRCVP